MVTPIKHAQFHKRAKRLRERGRKKEKEACSDQHVSNAVVLDSPECDSRTTELMSRGTRSMASQDAGAPDSYDCSEPTRQQRLGQTRKILLQWEREHEHCKRAIIGSRVSSGYGRMLYFPRVPAKSDSALEPSFERADCLLQVPNTPDSPVGYYRSQENTRIHGFHLVSLVRTLHDCVPSLSESDIALEPIIERTDYVLRVPNTPDRPVGYYRSHENTHRYGFLVIPARTLHGCVLLLVKSSTAPELAMDQANDVPVYLLLTLSVTSSQNSGFQSLEAKSMPSSVGRSRLFVPIRWVDAFLSILIAAFTWIYYDYLNYLSRFESYANLTYCSA